MISLTRSLGGKHERKPRERQEAEITNDRLERKVHVQEREFNAGAAEARIKHSTDNAGQKEHIDAALNGKGLGFCRRLEAVGHIFLKAGAVNEEVNKEQYARAQEPRQHQVFGRPEEPHALQEAQEQRRVTERRERAAHVCHEKDEEDEGLHLAGAAGVGFNQRANEEHCRPRRAHEVSEHSTEPQKRHIDDRTAHK